MSATTQVTGLGPPLLWFYLYRDGLASGMDCFRGTRHDFVRVDVGTNNEPHYQELHHRSILAQQLPQVQKPLGGDTARSQATLHDVHNGALWAGGFAHLLFVVSILCCLQSFSDSQVVMVFP